MTLQWEKIDPLLKAAIQEDLNKIGDITSSCIISKSKRGEGIFIVKEAGMIAGLPVVKRLFQMIDRTLVVRWDVADGASVHRNQNIGYVLGVLRNILCGERIALNLLQRLSGIATLTSHFVQAVQGTRVKINDTRKTTPLLRFLEKYAVRMGGGLNHRFGLYDMVLIKDNHIDAVGNISQAIENCLKNLKKKQSDAKIEVETRTLDEVRKAIQYPIHRIMLDNMDFQTIREAVKIINHKTEVEVSGNVSLESIGDIAQMGVDFISVGALTHSPKAMDISFKMIPTQ